MISKTGPGLLLLVGITYGDDKAMIKRAANKVLKMRLWPEIQKSAIQTPKGDNEETKEVDKKVPKAWASSVVDNAFELMVVSQFTLYAVMKGAKPDFHAAMEPNSAREIFDSFVEELRKVYKPERIQTGKFGNYMNVGLINDGPVTIVYDTDNGKDSDKSDRSDVSDVSSKSQKSNKQNNQKEQKKDNSPEQKQQIQATTQESQSKTVTTQSETTQAKE